MLRANTARAAVTLHKVGPNPASHRQGEAGLWISQAKRFFSIVALCVGDIGAAATRKPMTNKHKKRIRQRMAETGRSYCSTLNELRRKLRQREPLIVGGDAHVDVASRAVPTSARHPVVLGGADKRPRRHLHGHKLLVYRGTDQENWNEREIIWNSRNAKAPSFICGLSGNELMMVSMKPDDDEPIGHRYAPDYVPRVGERVFVELTEERARILATAQITREWSDPEQRAELDYNFATREDAVRETASSLLDHGYPDMVVVTPAYLEELAAQRMAVGPAASIATRRAR